MVMMSAAKEEQDMPDKVDVAVVGAGGAGLSAAYVAAEAGCSVIVLDSNPRTGGQYHRQAQAEPSYRPAQCTNSRVWESVRVRTGVTVFAAEKSERGFHLHTRGSDRARGSLDVVDARAIVVATGAYDRHLPVPGWELPGVMAGGGAQSLIKGNGVLPGKRIVVAGTGPFLLAVAQTVIDAGGTVVAVVEAQQRRTFLSPALVFHATSKIGQFGRFMTTLARNRVPYLFGHRVIAVHGDSQVDSVTIARVNDQWESIPGTDRQLVADTLAIGFGFTAQTELLTQLGCRMRESEDGGLAVVVDGSQHTNIPGVFAAGETTGVGGVDLAEVEGLLAGAGVARWLTKQPHVSGHKALVRKRHRLRAFARELGKASTLRDGWKVDLADDTIICRCEEVTAGAMRAAIEDLGATDPRSVKLLTRAGMGWCQGRMCTVAVDSLCPTRISTAAKVAAATRPLAIPVPLGALDDNEGDTA